MRNKFFFIVAFITFLMSCGPSEDKEEQQMHPALLNPVVKPYTEALASDPDNADLYFKRAEMLHKIEMMELSRADLEAAVRLQPENLEYRESLASLLIDMGSSEAALAQVDLLKKQVPNDTNYILMQAQAYLAGNNTVAAGKIVQDLLADMPQHPYVLLEAAKIAAAEKDTLKALGYAGRIAATAPRFYDGVYYLADLYNAIHDPKAVDWYHKLYQLDTLNAFPFYDIAKYYRSLGEDGKAKQYLVKAVMVDRDFVRAYLDYGNMLLLEDSLEKADRQFQIATQVAPANAEAYYGKALVNIRKGETALAKRFLEQTLIFDGGHAAAKTALEKIREQE